MNSNLFALIRTLNQQGRLHSNKPPIRQNKQLINKCLQISPQKAREQKKNDEKKGINGHSSARSIFLIEHARTIWRKQRAAVELARDLMRLRAMGEWKKKYAKVKGNDNNGRSRHLNHPQASYALLAAAFK